MPYKLLTGATGLLGRYLLRDLLLAGQSVAVVVRASRRESAQQRIEGALTRFENELGRDLPRPIIFEGDLTQPMLGLSQEEMNWLTGNADTIIHSAAKLTFQAESPEGEPYRSNVQGTRNVLELCKKTNIQRMHHVSTAYVCGLRSGVILENELDVGQEMGNDYEISKLTSEKEVRETEFFNSITVHRPAIIVGDSQTGYTNTFHGFYSPLRFIHSVLGGLSQEQVLGVDYLQMLGLSGSERKNFVPVDWVSAVMTRVILNESLHGKTYNLSSLAPVTVGRMRQCFENSLVEFIQSAPSKLSQSFGQHDYEAAFHDQMGVYQSYWKDDPTFDCRNTLTAAPDLPCPYVDDETLIRLCRFALQANFGWPCEPAIEIEHDIHGHMAALVNAGKNGIDQSTATLVGLQVTGNGGGDWELVLENELPVAALAGWKSSDSPKIHLNSSTFDQLASGQLNPTEALRTGQIAVLGNGLRSDTIARLLTRLHTSDKADLALSSSR